MTDELLSAALRQIGLVYEEFDAAESSLELLDTLLRQCPLPLLAGDDDYLLAASRSFMTLLGHTWSRRESIAWREILHPDDLAAAFGCEQHGVWRCRRYDGSYVPLSVWLSPPNDLAVRVAVGFPAESLHG